MKMPSRLFQIGFSLFFVFLIKTSTAFALELELTRTVKANSTVNSLSFSPDNKTLAAGTRQGIQFFDTTSGRLKASRAWHKGWVNALEFSPDGKILATASDKQVRLWDVRTLRVLATLQGHKTEVVTLNFSPDGKFIASGSWEEVDEDTGGGEIKVWNVAARKIVRTTYRGDGVPTLAYSPDGKLLVGVSGGLYQPSIMHFWHGRTLQHLHKRKIKGNLRDFGAPEVSDIVFSPSGETLLVVSYDNSFDTAWRFFNSRTGRLEKQFRKAAHLGRNLVMTPAGIWATVEETEDFKSQIQFYNLSSNRPIHLIPNLTSILNIAFSHGGTTLAAGFENGDIKLWRIF
jgi:WD40 repeat protein